MGIKVEMTEGKEVQPDVTQKKEEVKEVTPVKQAEEPKYVKVEDLEKVNQAINNTREYSNRKYQEILDKLDKLAPKDVATPSDDLDELVQKDWKLGVKEVTRQVLEEERIRASAQTEEQKIALLLEQSKAKVMAKHPELSDPDSPKTKEFLRVLDENPDFKSNPRGPLLAAYEMENRLKEHGSIEDGSTKVERPIRAKGGSVPAGTSASQKNGYTLTKSDMDFCRLNGINPENYKRYKGQTEARV